MRNLEECKRLFEASDSLNKSYAVHLMEQLGEWETAAKYWGIIGRKSDQQACQNLANAIKLGDEYREKTAHLRKWVDETVSKGIMTHEEAVKKVYPEMHKIYSENLQ